MARPAAPIAPPSTTAAATPPSAITAYIFCLVLQSASATLTAAPVIRRVPDEQRLYETIMNDYQLSVMPRLNFSVPLSVAFSLRLNQIVSLDERQQVLTTNVFIDQTWIDPALAWDPTNFSDVRALRIPADHVWLPDTFVYNNADGGTSGFMQGTYVQIQSNGRVLWPVPLRLRSSCSVRITYFPFDSQVCTLRFGSWIYGMSQVDYTPLTDGLTVDLSTYINNSEWELVGITMNKAHSLTPTGGPGVLRRLGPHSLLTYVLHLKRNTFFYLFNIIVPCVMLSTLNILTFWLPPVSGEKVTLGLSVFLAFSMFMLLIAEEVPATSEAVPLIGVYLCVVMTMTSLSVIMAVVVTNLYHRGRKMRAAPRWLVRVCLHWLAAPFCVSNDVTLIASTVDLVEHCQYDLSRRKKSQATIPNDNLGAQPNDVSHPAGHSSLNGNISSLPCHVQNGGFVGSAVSPMSQVNPGLSSLWRSFRQKTRTMKEVHPRARNSVTNSYQFARVPTTSDDDDDDQEEVWVKRRCSQSDDISDNGNDEYDDDADRAERSSQTLTSRPRFSLTCSNTEWDGKTQWDSNSQWDSTTQWDSAVSREEAHAGCEFSSLSAMRDGHDVANSASNTEAKLDHRVTSVDVHDHHPAHPSKPDPHPVCADKADPHPARVDKLDPHPDSSDLDAARRLVAEWQQIATVVDRLIFVLYLLSTVTAYVVILAVVPANQPPVANATLDTAGTAFSFYQWTR